MKHLRGYIAGFFVIVFMSSFAWAGGFQVGELLATSYNSIYNNTTDLDLVIAVPEPSVLIDLLAATVVGLLILGFLVFLNGFITVRWVEELLERFTES
jgi:hypothetical protein